MGWGTRYTYHGYLSHLEEGDLHDTLDTDRHIREDCWRQLLALAAATPPPHAVDDEGEKYPYEEYLSMRFQAIRASLEEAYLEIHHIEDCLEALNDERKAEAEEGNSEEDEEEENK